MNSPYMLGGSGASNDLVTQLLQSGTLNGYNGAPSPTPMGALGTGFTPPSAAATPMGGFGSTMTAGPPGMGNYAMVNPGQRALGMGSGGPGMGLATIEPTMAGAAGAGGIGAAESIAAQAAGAAPGFLGRALGGAKSNLGFLLPGSEMGLKAGMGGLVKGGLTGAAISTAGQLAGHAVGGKGGRAISDAATGAGLGMMIGPEGAVIGGALGGLYGLLAPGKKKPADFTQTLDGLTSSANMSPSDIQELKLTYSILKQTSGDAAAQQQVGQMILGKLQAGKTSADNQSKMLATQALTSQFFQPFTQQLLDSAQMRHQDIQSMLPSLPAEYRGVAAAQSAASLDNATRSANAYAAQAQLMPATAALQSQQALQQQASQQLAAQAMSGGGGSQSLAQLIGG